MARPSLEQAHVQLTNLYMTSWTN